MKKTFSCFAALLVSMLLLVTSCSNGTQVQFQDESKGDYTENGLSVLTVKVGSTPTYERTIFPDDWKQENMATLSYKLTAEPDDGAATQKETAAAGKTFTYAQIISGQATMELDPEAWTFTLEALQGDQKVLIAKATADLSTGGQMVEFALTPVRTSTTATGKVTIDLNFFKEDGLKKVSVKTYKIDSVTGAVLTEEPKTKPTAIDIQDIGVKGSDMVGSDPLHRKVTYQGDMSVGIHMLTAVFSDAAGKELLKYEEQIVVDGGNNSSKAIHIPRGSYNKVPAPVENLTASCEYVPQQPKLVVSEVKKIYASQAANDTTDIETDKYDLILTWDDKAFNEAGYKIELTTESKDSAKTSQCGKVTVSYNKDEPAAPTVEGNHVTVKTSSGTLGPSTESITLQVPTGVFCKDIKIIGYNAIGEQACDPIASSAEIQKENSVSGNLISKSDPLGMFTVAYNLIDPNTGATGAHNAAVKYNIAGGTTDKQYFVVAYKYGEKGDAIKAKGDSPVYPFVSHEKFNFSGWKFADGTSIKSDAPVDFKTINNANLVKADAGPYDFTNQNITVIGSWTVTASVSVKFPKYNGLKELQVTDKLMGEVLELKNVDPVADPKNGIATVGIPAEARTKVTKLSYTIYKPAVEGETASKLLTTVNVNDGGDSVKDGIVSGIEYDNVSYGIKITAKTLLEQTGNVAGIYRIYVKYLYDDSDVTGMKDVPVDGNLYVRISNDATN